MGGGLKVLSKQSTAGDCLVTTLCERASSGDFELPPASHLRLSLVSVCPPLHLALQPPGRLAAAMRPWGPASAGGRTPSIRKQL